MTENAIYTHDDMEAALARKDKEIARLEQLLAAPQPAPSGEAVTVTDAMVEIAARAMHPDAFADYERRLNIKGYGSEEDCRRFADHYDDRPFAQARRALEAALSTLPAAPQGWVQDNAQTFDGADWYWRTMDPDDSGDSPEEALNSGMVGCFVVCEVASSFTGPTRYGFTAPVLDPDSDDEEFVHFATEKEALDAAKARAAAPSKGEAQS